VTDFLKKWSRKFNVNNTLKKVNGSNEQVYFHHTLEYWGTKIPIDSEKNAVYSQTKFRRMRLENFGANLFGLNPPFSSPLRILGADSDEPVAHGTNFQNFRESS